MNEMNDRTINISEEYKYEEEQEKEEYHSSKNILFANNNNQMEHISESEQEDEKNPLFEKLEQNLKRDEYKINEAKLDELLNNNMNSKEARKLFIPTNTNNAYDDQQNEFNSHNNLFKINIPKQTNTKKGLRDHSTDGIKSQVSSDHPIELSLYADAIKRKEKNEKLEYNNMMEILINSSKNKISNKSYQIAINKIEKDIDQAVSMVTDIKLNKINFIQLGEIFALLKIFRELFPIDNTNRTREKRFQNYREIKMELKSIKSQEKRKKKEVEFYEQLWMTLNPDNKADIRADTTREFLKILFSPLSSSIDEISLILSKFLQASFFLNSNNENSKMIISPITEKSISEEDLWPIDKLVREFLNLKENLLAYQRIHNYTNRAIENINKDRKDWTFKPSIPGINTKYSEIDFEDRISKFIESKKDKLGKMSKEIEEQKIKECTFKPNIISKQKGYPNEKEEKTYDRLYKKHREKLEERNIFMKNKEKYEEDNEMKECTFEPKINTNIPRSQLYENSMTSKELKIYEQTIERMRNGILENFKKKYLAEKIPTGENYDKIRKANIKPFNITDLRKKETDTTIVSDSKEEFFSIQITLPNGKDRILKISKNDDPNEIASNFCKVYGLKSEIRARLTKTIIHFINLYLNKNISVDDNNENFSNIRENDY